MKYSMVSRLQTVLAAVALLFVSTVCFGQIGLERAIEVQKNKNKELFKNDGIVATGISVDSNGKAVIKVFTKDANVKGVPAALNGVIVRTQVSGKFFAYDDKKLKNIKKQAPPPGKGKPGGNDGGGDDPQTRFPRPVPIGVSVGSTGPNVCFAGTLGCRLKRFNLATGAVDYFILSNNHVLADENNGTSGVDGILQPGTLDNGCVLDPADVIGVLTDFVPIRFGGQTNLVDAAIASTTTSDTGFASPASAYGAPSSTTVTAVPGMLVKKFGRTTSFTEGIVDSVNVTVNVGYDNGTATFVDQIVIQGRRQKGKRFVASSFSEGGDSGSLIVTQDGNNPTGLLFAGNSSFTIANPIDTVLDSFSDAGNGVIYTVDDGN